VRRIRGQVRGIVWGSCLADSFLGITDEPM